MPVELSWQPGRDVLFCVQVARRKHPLCGYKRRNREICRVGKGQGAGVGWHPVQSLGRWYSMASAPPPPALQRPCLHPCSASVLMLSISICWVGKCSVPCGAVLRSLFLCWAPMEPFWQAWWAVSCAVGLTVAEHWNREAV